MTKPLKHGACGKPLRSVYVDEVRREALWTLHAGKWRLRSIRTLEREVFLHAVCMRPLSPAETRAFLSQISREAGNES